MQANLTQAEEDDLPTMAFIDFYDYGDYEAYEVSFAAYKLQYTEVRSLLRQCCLLKLGCLMKLHDPAAPA